MHEENGPSHHYTGKKRERRGKGEQGEETTWVTRSLAIVALGASGARERERGTEGVIEAGTEGGEGLSGATCAPIPAQHIGVQSHSVGTCQLSSQHPRLKSVAPAAPSRKDVSCGAGWLLHPYSLTHVFWRVSWHLVFHRRLPHQHHGVQVRYCVVPPCLRLRPSRFTTWYSNHGAHSVILNPCIQLMIIPFYGFC